MRSPLLSSHLYKRSYFSCLLIWIKPFYNVTCLIKPLFLSPSGDVLMHCWILCCLFMYWEDGHDASWEAIHGNFLFKITVTRGGSRGRGALKLEKIRFVCVKSWFFTRIPQKISRLPPLGAIFLSAPPLTWNPGSASGNDNILFWFDATDC
jgi:hypothetical protein